MFMSMPGPIEILIMLIVGGLIISALLGVGRGTKSKSKGGGFSLGHATLTCPHCQQETTAGKHECENCGHDL